MGDDASAIDGALAAVRRTLDGLTARGLIEPAFEIARAQFTASIRASWPANLTQVATAIDLALSNTELALLDEEREELRRAAQTLRAVQHG
jgi:hypothetical protein